MMYKKNKKNNKENIYKDGTQKSLVRLLGLADFLCQGNREELKQYDSFGDNLLFFSLKSIIIKKKIIKKNNKKISTNSNSNSNSKKSSNQ